VTQGLRRIGMADKSTSIPPGDRPPDSDGIGADDDIRPHPPQHISETDIALQTALAQACNVNRESGWTAAASQKIAGVLASGSIAISLRGRPPLNDDCLGSAVGVADQFGVCLNSSMSRIVMAT